MTYKILAISDTHILKKYPINVILEKFKDIDFIISAGDVSNDYLDYLASILNKDIIYVNGNHVYNKKHNISFCINIDGKLIKYKELYIFGLDGSRVYSFKEHQYTEREMFIKILKNIHKLFFHKPDIVVTHAPIRHIHDKEEHVHKGFRVFYKVLNWFHPKLWIHGHIHLSNHYEIQETEYNGTRIINAYGYKIIEFQKDA
ncbi:MAG: uncharacterized protein PWP46_552 [Fusobacteriaceae bacterium]|jgi:Icc-related predicted phosphoesterase|nr:hypothetical protein [Fusobacteriales bacterium]MDN5303673.1 uncharacterized protein [Fusobacteriaceae bacterium]